MKTSFFKQNRKSILVGGSIFCLLALASLVYAATGSACDLYVNGTDQRTGNNFTAPLPSGWSLLRQVCKRSKAGFSNEIIPVQSEYGANISATNNINKDVHIPFGKKKELIKFINATRDSDSDLFVGNGYVNTMHPSGGANPGLPQGVQLCAEGQSDPLTIAEASTDILGYKCSGTYETTLPGSCEGNYTTYSYACEGADYVTSGAHCSGAVSGLPAGPYGPDEINPGMACEEANIFQEDACEAVNGCDWYESNGVGICKGEAQISDPMANPQFFYPEGTLCTNIETHGSCRTVPGCGWNSNNNTCDGVVDATTPRNDLPQNGMRCGRDIGGNTAESCGAVAGNILAQQFAPFGNTSAVTGCTWVPEQTAQCASLSSASSCNSKATCTWTQSSQQNNCNNQSYEIPCEAQNPTACEWVEPVGTVNCPSFEFESANNPEGYTQTDCKTATGQFSNGNAACNWETIYSESAEIPGCDLPPVANACGELDFVIDSRDGASYPVKGSFSNPLLPGVSTPLDNCWMKADLDIFDSVYQDSSDPVDLGAYPGENVRARVYIKSGLFDVLDASSTPYDAGTYDFDLNFLASLDSWTELDSSNNINDNDVIGPGALQMNSALVKSIPKGLKTYCDFHNETENKAGDLVTVVVEKVDFTALANGGLNSGARGYNVACGYFVGATSVSSDWANGMNAFIKKTGVTDFGLTDFNGSRDFGSGFFGAVCPAGWRLPTPEEFDSARSIFGSDGQMQVSLNLSEGGYTSANSVWNYFDTNHQHNDIGGYYPVVTKMNAGYVNPILNYSNPEFKQSNPDVGVYANQNPTQIPQSGQIRCVKRDETFFWKPSDWSATCSNDLQSRTISCNNGSIDVHNGWCYGLTKPIVSRDCPDELL